MREPRPGAGPQDIRYENRATRRANAAQLRKLPKTLQQVPKAEWPDTSWLDMVEVYPADNDVVNVSNMRHLWVFDEPLNFCWRAV